MRIKKYLNDFFSEDLLEKKFVWIGIGITFFFLLIAILSILYYAFSATNFNFLKSELYKLQSQREPSQEKELKHKIWKTFKNISEGYAKVLRLKYIEGLSYAQIAQRLGKTVKAVESKLSRARKAFQKEYAKEAAGFEKDWSIFTSDYGKRELPF